LLENKYGISETWYYVVLRHVRKIAKSISFVISVCPSVRMEQLGSHWTDCHEILYLFIFLNAVEKIQVPSKSDKNTGSLLEDRYTFLITSRSVLVMKYVSDKSCRETQNTHFMFNYLSFRKSCRVWDNVEKIL